MTDTALDSRAPGPGARAQSGPQGGDAIDWLKITLGFGGMIIGQFMAMLDTQIVSSSLSQIQAGVGASTDQMSWIQTIYMLAEVIIIPVSAYLTKMVGTRPFFVVAAAGFVVTSVATAFSSTFEMMILTRGLQGLAAGAMMPTVFATAMTIFPPDKRITANVITGLVITIAPTIGPTLGGHLTEALGWRWLFFINVPIGLLVIFLVGRWGGFDKGDPKLAKGVDWYGLAWMTIFLLSTQFVIEEGPKSGWFQSGAVLWLTVLSAVTLVCFVWRQLSYSQPILSLKPFSDRNFALAMTMLFVSGMSLFGGMFVLPLYLAQVMGYSAAEVGTTLIAGGLTMFIAAPLIGALVRRLDPRLAMFLGYMITAYGMGMGARVTGEWDFWDFALMQVVRSMGLIIAMIAAQQLSISTLPISLMKDASSLMSLIRNVGGAVGVAMMSSLLSHQTAVHLGDLSVLVNSGNASSNAMMEGLAGLMQQNGASDPEGGARKAFSMILRRNAQELAYGDAFVQLALAAVFAACLALLAKPAPAAAAIPHQTGGH